MARPPSGAKLVDGVEGSAHAKRRLEWILKTIGGEATIAEACDALGIGEAAFHKLRTRFLHEGVKLLEPRPVGRPPKAPDRSSEDRVRALEAELEEVRREHQAAEVRAELAAALPGLPSRKEKKKKLRSRERRRRRRV